MALKLKSKSASKANLLKVSKYENTQEAINLMAKICSIKNRENPVSLEGLHKIYDQLKQYQEEKEVTFSGEFISGIEKIISDTEIHINQKEIKGYTKVVVAGGYSAGKSSMINKITNIGKLLPEGIEPVSVIATYVYCTNKKDTRKIQGENLKGSLVDLDESVLECIQHSSKSKIYLASVLEKIYVETYAPEYDGIVFIDTPGYNNSSDKNIVNSRTDKETAVKEFSNGDVLLWLIDCEAGTISTTDLEIIQQFNGKKIIVFTKSYKKDERSLQDIIDSAAKQLNIKKNEDILDILAFSTEKGFSNSYKGYKNENLVSMIKNATQPHSILEDLEKVFDNERYKLSQMLYYNEEKAKSNLKKVSNLNKNISILDNGKKLEEEFEEVIKSYNKINRKFDELYHIFLDALKEIKDYNRYTQLTNRVKKAVKFEYYKHSYLKELKNKFINLINFNIHILNNEHNTASDEQKSWKEKTKKCEEQLKKLKSFYQAFSTEIRKIKNEHSAYQENVSQRQKPQQEEVVYSVFDAIKIDNIQAFYNSLSKGVDITVCNEEKYNPITWAVRYGNNEIVKIFLDQNVDFSIKDDNGYNGLETAVIHQFKDIYELIMDSQADKFSKSDFENLSILAEKHKDNFRVWLNNTINSNK